MMASSELYKEVLDNLLEGMYLVDEKREIVFWNSAAEKATGYPVPEIMGKHCRNTLIRHTNYKGTCLCRDACPMEKTFKDLRTREIDVYTHHRDGTRVLNRIQFSPIKDPNGRTLVAVKFYSADSGASRKRLFDERLMKDSPIDQLPSVLSRQEMETKLGGKLDELRRYGWSFGVMVIAVDKYENLISQYGFPYWHKVLRMVTEVLAGNLRTSDVVGRWNENELIVLTMNVGTRELKLIAERVRVLVAQSHLSFYKEEIHCAVGIGASTALSEDSVPALMERCAILLKKSIHSGCYNAAV